MITKPRLIILSTVLIIAGLLTGFLVSQAAIPEPTPNSALNVEVTPRNVKLAPNQPCEFTAHVYNGSAPYSYRWSFSIFGVNNETLVDNAYLGKSNPIIFQFNESASFANLDVEVTDLAGATGYATVIVYDPSVFTLSSGIYPGAPSYTIWREGYTYYAKSAYGSITYSGPDAVIVIQSAVNTITSGGTISFAQATYSCASKITILRPVVIEGNLATLDFDGVSDYLINICPVDEGFLVGPELRNLIIQGDTHSLGVNVTRVACTHVMDNVIIENCTGENAAGLYLKGVENCLFTTVFSSSNTNGMTLIDDYPMGANLNLFKSCNFQASTDNGVQIQSTSTNPSADQGYCQTKNVFDTCSFGGSGGWGFTMGAGYENTIKDSWFEDNDLGDLQFTNWNDSSPVHNTITNSKFVSSGTNIYCVSDLYTTITYNAFGGDVLFENDCLYPIINYNRFQGNEPDITIDHPNQPIEITSNAGFITEQSGAAWMENGNNNITITFPHAFPFSPTSPPIVSIAGDVDGPWFVGATYNETYFEVFLDGWVAGESTVLVCWRAQLLPLQSGG